MEHALDKLIEAILGRSLANWVFGWILTIAGAILLWHLFRGLVQEVRERRHAPTSTTERPAFWVISLMFIIPALFGGCVVFGGIILLSSARQPQAVKPGIGEFNKSEFLMAYLFHKYGIDALEKKDYDKAIDNFSETLRLDPMYAPAFSNRGIAYYHKKDYHKARADYSEAIRLDPKDYWAFNNLGWLLATCPKDSFRDGKKVVEHALKACELSQWKEGNTLGTLAAAKAEIGDFKEAVEWQKKAMRLRHEENEGIEKARLKLYEEGKPYRDKE